VERADLVDVQAHEAGLVVDQHEPAYVGTSGDLDPPGGPGLPGRAQDGRVVEPPAGAGGAQPTGTAEEVGDVAPCDPDGRALRDSGGRQLGPARRGGRGQQRAQLVVVVEAHDDLAADDREAVDLLGEADDRAA